MICQKCILPIDNNLNKNKCCYCSNDQLLKHITSKPNESELRKLMALVKKQGQENQYDCIVGWSGGRDSTHLIRLLTQDYHLRVLAVFGQTPFTPPEIVENIHSISTLLKIDVITIEPHRKHLEVSSYCLKKYLRDHNPILVNLACAPCKFINREIFKIAKKNKINTIFYGGNHFEYFPNGPASIDLNDSNRYSFKSMIRDNCKRIIKGLSSICKSPSLLKYFPLFSKASILFVNQYTVYFRLRYRTIQAIDFYHYKKWDENEVNHSLKTLNWTLPKGCNTTWRADCTFESVKNSIFHKELGFTYNTAFYSNMIRSGYMNRNEALARIKREKISSYRLKKSLDLCGISESRFKSGTKI
jgi:hypothetical protein